MIRKSLYFATLLTVTAAFIYAQDKAPGKKAARITGFLVDNMCVKGADNVDRQHETACALMPKCAASGYAIVAKDTVYKLDGAGNKLALEILKTTKQKQGVAVSVVGTLNEGVLQVDSMEEVQPA